MMHRDTYGYTPDLSTVSSLRNKRDPNIAAHSNQGPTILRALPDLLITPPPHPMPVPLLRERHQQQSSGPPVQFKKDGNILTPYLINKKEE